MPNWNGILNEITKRQIDGANAANSAIDDIRREYLKKLNNYTKRTTIAYYSGWLSKPGILQSDLNDEDKNGFMMAVHEVDRDAGLDLILHTPGGSIAATQSIVNYLHKMFGNNIRAIIPQIAMSAGTMVACSCKSIVMGKQSNLGPIDPQFRGIPAYGVKHEFLRAIREIKKDPDKLHIWREIIGQYRPTFLSQCENAIKESNAFVQNQLENVMFNGKRNKSQKAKKVVNGLTNYKQGHDRHIHVEECEKIGLVIEKLEDDDKLQDLVLTVHHCYMNTIMNSKVYKIIENHKGVALIKNAKEG